MPQTGGHLRPTLPPVKAVKGVLTLETPQQRAALKATTSCGQVVAVFAFLAERLLFMVGLEW